MNSIAQCIALVEKNVIWKKLKIKRPVLREFVVHVLLVLLGVRDGYLVDCLHFTADDLKTILQHILVAAARSHVRISADGCEHSLLIVQLPSDDFIVLSPSWFSTRVQLLYSNNCGLFEHILLVDISGDCPPRAISPVEAAPLETHLRALIEPILAEGRQGRHVPTSPSHQHTVHVLSLRPDTTLFGLECLAGWLLGYTCVYSCATAPDFSSRYKHSLSMLPLHKKSMSLQVQCNLDGGNLYKAIVKEFTVPVHVLCDEENVDNYPQTHVSSEQFNVMVTHHIDAVKLRYEESGIAVAPVQLESEEVTYSSLVF